MTVYFERGMLAGCKAAGPGCPEAYWNTSRTNGTENAAAGQQDRSKPKACELCGLCPRLVDDLIQGFGMAAPLYHYLLDTIVQAKQPGP